MPLLLCKHSELLREHAVVCHERGDFIARQDRIRDRIATICSLSNLSPLLEKRNPSADNNSDPETFFCHHGCHTLLLLLMLQ